MSQIELGPFEIEKLKEQFERGAFEIRPPGGAIPPRAQMSAEEYFDRHTVIYDEPDEAPTSVMYEIVGRLAYCTLGIAVTIVLALLFVSCGPIEPSVEPSEPKSAILNPCAELCGQNELCKCNQVCRTVDRATECHVWVRR